MADEQDQKSVQDAMDLIMQAVNILGWEIAFKRPDNPNDTEATIEYLIIGTADEVDRIVSVLEAPQNRI
jgi:hypothetical protein